MLEIKYISLSIVMFLIITIAFYFARIKFLKNKSQTLKDTLKLSFFILAWIAYIAILSFSKILLDYSLPPKFPMLIIIPMLIFSIVFYSKNKDNAFIQSIPLIWTSSYQSFRVFVEFILLSTFVHGFIPVEATYEGYNFDILIGFSAIFVSFLIYKTGFKYKSFLRFWNILGIVMILFVAFVIASANYQPQIWSYEVSPVSEEFLKLPLLLIPTFLAPSAIFIHLISLIQLNRKDTSIID